MVSLDFRAPGRLLSSAYLRITLSGVTLSFFLLSISFCLLQILFQAFLWSSDTNAYNTLDGMMKNTAVPPSLLRWLTVRGNDYHFMVCSEAPYGAKNVSETCPTVFDSLSTAQPDWVAPPNVRINSSLSTAYTPQLTVSLASEGKIVTLTEQCTYTLLYPTQRLRNSMNEELSLIFSQLWLLGITSSAVIGQSIPHILAVFAMRVLATGWSAYTIWRTRDLRTRLWHIMIAPNTPCHTDFEFLPQYFKNRLAFQIPDLILNVAALFFTAILGWHLIKSFSKHVFNYVGPPARIIRLYGYMLTVLVSGQLLLYLMIISISLALKEAITTHAKLLGVDIALFNVAVILALAMIALGYYSTRNEKKRSMIVFIGLLIGFITAFFSLFAFPAFRFSWLQWPFFACVTGVNAAVLICCTIFAILCRLHFGEGLSHYLHVQQVLSAQRFASDDFPTEDVKVRDPDQLSIALPAAKVEEKWDVIDQTRAPIYTVRLDINGRVEK